MTGTYLCACHITCMRAQYLVCVKDLEVFLLTVKAMLVVT